MSKPEGNKKSRRAAAKAEQAEQAQTATLAPTPEIAEQQAIEAQALSDQAAGIVEETTEVEGTPAKADPNAASKAKAESNRKAKAEKATADMLAKYPHVTKVTQSGPNGPTRVEISCTDPQTKQVEGKAVSVCQKTREIAVQDLFQVTRCVACQDRVLRKARRTRQSKKNKDLRKFAREMKGGL